MSEKLIIKNSTVINAPISRVWNALMNPDYTKHYMFGCRPKSDWKKGSELLWEGEHEGKTMVFVKGTIKEIEQEKTLKYTVIDPNSAMADIPANYLDVTYTLENRGDRTGLTVVQDGFEGAENGENRYKDVDNNGEGWAPILREIKRLVEATKS